MLSERFQLNNLGGSDFQFLSSRTQEGGTISTVEIINAENVSINNNKNA